jgi:DNA-directed RNA polymerase subunit RPC12/RpoP
MMERRSTQVSYLSCPMCDAEVPLDGDETVGEQVYCPYCQAPLALKKKKGEDETYLEEDF